MKEVNKPIGKIDGMGLVTGKPAYTDDLAPANALVVKVLRSPHAFARIKSIDMEEALKLAGVECILTHKDFPRNAVTRAGQGYPEPSPHDKFVLDEYVRYVGDEAAIVAAVDQRTALEALELIKVEYEVLEPVLDFEKAEDNPSVIHPEPEAHAMFGFGYEPKRNVVTSFEMKIGDFEKTLSECDVVVRERYYTQAQAHVMMEPHTSFASVDYQGRLVVVSSTQTPYHVRRIISHALGFPISKIRVIKPRIGGGFGGKQAIHGEFFVSAVALKTGKPARLTYNRQEVFESTYRRHPMRFDMVMGADKTGKMKAVEMKILSNTGAYGEHAMTTFMVTGSKSLPLYNKVEAINFDGKVVYTNMTPCGAFRGYGALQAQFALESTVDKLAHALGMDPVVVRQMNMIGEGQTSAVFEAMGEGGDGFEMIIESCKLDYCVKRGMELINWKEKYPKKQISSSKVRGVGMAIAMHGSGIPFVDMGSAVIKLNDEGFFNLLVGATDLGTGSDTILAQIAAETLGVSTDKVIVYSSDTDLTPFDTGAYATSTTYISGNAVKNAAEKMKRLIEEEGARRLGVTTEEVEFDGERVKAKATGKSIPFNNMSNKLYYNSEQRQLVAVGSYVGHKSPPPYAAGFAEVEVDLETGKVELIEYVVVADCGTAINPNLARIQVEGGMAQGIGLALFEDVKHTASGKLMTNNLMYYKVPTRKDIRKLTVELADSYEPTGPYGAKSAGEIGIDTPPSAIANAVFNATGVRITSLPITPEKVLTGLKGIK